MDLKNYRIHFYLSIKRISYNNISINASSEKWTLCLTVNLSVMFIF